MDILAVIPAKGESNRLFSKNLRKIGGKTLVELAIEYRKPLVLLSPNGEWDAFSKLAPAVKTVEDAVEKI